MLHHIILSHCRNIEYIGSTTDSKILGWKLIGNLFCVKKQLGVNLVAKSAVKKGLVKLLCICIAKIVFCSTTVTQKTFFLNINIRICLPIMLQTLAITFFYAFSDLWIADEYFATAWSGAKKFKKASKHFIFKPFLFLIMWHTACK